MPIELPNETRTAAIASIERYFSEEHGERIGNMAAGALLNFFLADIGPAVYNLAVAQAQERMQARVADLDIELHEEPLTWWTQRKSRP